MKLNKQTSITWLGHGTFLITTPKGRKILIDPWLQNNPATPPAFKDPGPIDLVLLTHAHFDHIGDVIPVAQKTNAKIVGNFELCHWLESKGVNNIISMNKGGTLTFKEFPGLSVTMTHAIHSSGILDKGVMLYGGDAAGFVIQMENGFTIYHAGDTAVFGDMAIIRDIYQPELVILPIGDNFTMSPREAAYACRLLKPRYVIPGHYGTFPVLNGTPEDFKKALSAELETTVFVLKPGETLQ